MHSRVCVFLFSCLTCIPCTHAADFFIAPNGDDTGPGTFEQPLKTLAGAQARVRSASFRGRETIKVFLRKGTYYLPKALQLDARDSGTASAPVIYTAYAGEKVIVSGGAVLTPSWTPAENGIYRTSVKAGMVFDQLFINGSRQVLARYPNYDKDASPYNGASPDAFSKARASRWHNPAGGFIHAMHRHHWGGYHYRITGKNSNSEVVYEGGWQNNRQMGMHPKHRMVENIREELDAPGEWFLDSRNDLLFYLPLDPKMLPTAIVEAAQLRHLVEFAGSTEQPVAHVSLNGLIFRHTTRTFMETREPLLRSDWTIYRGGAIVFQNAEHCGIHNCEFDQLGGNGVFVNKYNRHINISGCHFHHCGASGICFVGDPNTVRNPKFEYGQTNHYQHIDREHGPKGKNFPADCLVDDCLIHNMSVVEKQATGVQISMSKRITVRHCSIYDMGRAGINISEGTFGGHVIEHCDVFNTVRETGDHGSFNSWGRDRFWHLNDAPTVELPALSRLDTDPTIIRNSRWRCDHGWDVDLDDGSSHYEIYNNLFLKGGLKLREGFYRNVYNNIAINNTLHPHVWYDNSNDRVTRNIWMGAYRPAGGMPAGKWGVEIDHNFFTTQAAKQQHQNHGCDLHSLVGNPLFLDPANGDYRVGPKSSALKTGFKNFPMDRFGVRSESLKAIAKTPQFPAPSTTFLTAANSRPKKVAEVLWLGMTLRPLEGEQFSAFGVSREKGGLAITRLNPSIPSPLQIDDVIQLVNSHPVRDVETFLENMIKLQGEPVEVEFVRAQQTQREVIEHYPFVIVETAKTTASLKHLSVPLVQPRVIYAKPLTNNEPLSVLSDQQVAPNYGPVFANGVDDGCYKTDLGKLIPVKQLASWSYGLQARGTQKLLLYGSAATADPGWDPADFSPIGTIWAPGSPTQYTAAALRAAANRSLGSYRWILWQTQPINNVSGGENTAFQELAIESVPRR